MMFNNDVLGYVGNWCDPATSVSIKLACKNILTTGCPRITYLEYAITNNSIDQVIFGLENKCCLSDRVWYLLGKIGNIDIINTIISSNPISDKLYEGIGRNGSIALLQTLGWRDDMVKSLQIGAVKGSCINMLEYISQHENVRWVNVLFNYGKTIRVMEWLKLKSNVYAVSLSKCGVKFRPDIIDWLVNNIKYDASNYHYSVTMSDNLDSLKYLESKGFEPTDMSLNSCRSLSMLKHLISWGIIPNLRNNRHVTLEMLEYIFHNYQQYVINLIPLSNLDMLKWLVEHGYTLPNDILDTIIFHGRSIDELEYLVSIGFQLNFNHTVLAVENFQLGMIEYIHSQVGMYPNYRILYDIVVDYNNDVFSELIKLGYPADCDYISNYNFDIIKLIYESGVDLTPYIDDIEDFNILIWLMSKGLPCGKHLKESITHDLIFDPEIIP